MTGAADRWEHGSDFHWPRFEPQSEPAPPWSRGSLWASGRDALRALVAHRGWSRIWIPSYFCQQVTLALVATGAEVATYPDSPLGPGPRLPPASLAPGEALLAVNYFGLRGPCHLELPESVELIEDHSHDPLSAWARGSRADWCVASLRKSLPLPGGGALWSPAERQLPGGHAVRRESERTLARRFSAMLLKTLYLEGHEVAKQSFRKIAVDTEKALGSGEISCLPEWVSALLGTLPASRWRARRAPNHAALRDRLAGCPGARVLAADGKGTAPFCAFTIFDSAALAARVRADLVARRIYPARLWDLDRPRVAGIPAADVELARRSLALHCDHRYREEDMRRVADALRGAVEAGGAE